MNNGVSKALQNKDLKENIFFVEYILKFFNVVLRISFGFQ